MMADIDALTDTAESAVHDLRINPFTYDKAAAPARLCWRSANVGNATGHVQLVLTDDRHKFVQHKEQPVGR